MTCVGLCVHVQRLQQAAAALVGLPHVPSEADKFWLNQVRV